MSKNLRFWRNVTLIGAAHAVVIVGLIRWNSTTKPPDAQSVVWLNGGAGDGANAPAKPLPASKPAKISPPVPAAEEIKEDSREDHPVLTSLKSDIQLPSATPTPSPRATLTPKPNSSPRVKATPRPSPKAKPKATPKPSPKKIVIAKAVKPKPSPEEKKEKEDVDLVEKKKRALEALDKSREEASSPKPLKAIAAETGSGKGTSTGNGGHAAGSGGQSQFGWYGSMLHDRFYSEWVQPTSVAASGEKYSVLVKLRIEKDGRVSSFDVVKPSGNETLDESVRSVAKQVTQVDPLPAGLGNAEHYDVKINFELNSEQ